jgi:phage terminase small subunit
MKNTNKSMTQLTIQEQTFAYKYIETLDEKESAIYAGFDAKRAKHIGNNLLSLPHVQLYLSDLLDKKMGYLDVTIGEIVNELKKIAFSKKENTNTRLKALEMLGRYKNMWNDQKTIVVNQNPYQNWSEEDIEKELKRLESIPVREDTIPTDIFEAEIIEGDEDVESW